MKLSKANFSKPTPKKWSRLGTSLLAVSTTITGFALYTEHEIVAAVALICGAAGKFLTSFFTDEE